MVFKKVFGISLIFVYFNSYFIQAQGDNDSLMKNNIIAKIDSLAGENDFISAIEEYRHLQSIDTLKVSQYLEFASFFSQTKQKDSAFFYLDKIFNIDTSFSDLSTIYRSGLYFIVDDDRWNNWITKVMYNYNKNVKPIINFDYSKALINIRVKDNSFYRLVYFSERKYGKYSPTTVAIWELKERISRENVIVLESLIEKYGWPNFSMVGKEFSNIAFFIIQHAELEIQKKYLPIITEAYNNGESHFNWIAMLTDRVLLQEKKPQIYGSQGIWNPHRNKYVLYEVEDPEMCNKLRAKYKIGEPISEQAFKNMYNPNK